MPFREKAAGLESLDRRGDDDDLDDDDGEMLLSRGQLPNDVVQDGGWID